MNEEFDTQDCLKTDGQTEGDRLADRQAETSIPL